MPSAKRILVGALGLSAFATGCTTTQQQAARLQLNDARLRASLVPLHPGRTSRVVAVTSVTLIPGRHSAVIVALRNNSARAVSDLPLLVGIGRTYLNASSGIGYFHNHVPSIAAHGTLRWVLSLGRPLHSGAQPFAKVGPAAAAVAATPKALPRLRVKAGPGAVVSVQNDSGVPQYQLQVYTVARRAGRYVAAGQVTIADLGGKATARVRVPLVGDASGARLTLEAPPTIFN